MAAPASYWYLKAFPIADMAKEVDYIVYMTYDLHGEHGRLQSGAILTSILGQWDYKNIWAQDGCSAGNCVRSHGEFHSLLSSRASG